MGDLIPPFLPALRSWRVQVLVAVIWLLIAFMWLLIAGGAVIPLDPFGNIAVDVIAALVAFGLAVAAGSLARDDWRQKKQLRESCPDRERIP